MERGSSDAHHRAHGPVVGDDGHGAVSHACLMPIPFTRAST